ncbi:hypothetical protein DICVIV_11518 [Dictyocaulus viviparus]|uniref:Uncharacterized protein n=1 Tax=Dictyocaulus viviparus TaxID=29172 RepID=A0A0D8XD09_DICVI|nr:hypothetical protein DICVIV_11518 [Dictyocaulus viviparus]
MLNNHLISLIPRRFWLKNFVSRVINFLDPVSSAGRDTRFTPKYPVAVARRGLPFNARNSYPKSDWREDQCKKLLVCDVLESLPEHKQESFKRLMEILGTNVPAYRETSKRRYPGVSPAYYPDMDDSRPVSPRQGPQKLPRTVTYERRYVDQPRYVVTNPSSSTSRVVAMIPFEEKCTVDTAERSDVAEMPELIQNDMNEGERSVDPNDIDEVKVFYCVI